jgi:hypothetical protein
VDTAGLSAPPSTRVPGIVVLREPVAQAHDAAVMLLEARGYSQGFLLEFMAVARRARDGGSPVLGVDFGSGVLRPGGEPTAADRGRAVHRLPDEVEESRGGSAALGIKARLWITPLPPAEGFTVVIHWPGYGIDGQRGHVGGEAIRVAAWESFPCLPA